MSVVSSWSRLGGASDAGARRHYSPHAEKIMFQESAHTQSKRTSLGLVGFFVLALAVAPPVEGVIYYGGYAYGEEGFSTYGGAAVVVRPRGRRYRYYGRKLLQSEPEKECESMLDVIESRPMLSSLAEAIADLPRIRDALNNRTATDTFFAPSNKAIESFTKWGGFEDFEEGLSEMFSSEEIKALIIAYHAIPDSRLNWGQIRSKAAKGEFLLTALSKIFTNSSAALEPSFWKGDVFLKGIGSEAKIVAADIPACGSVVHIVDGVLLPLDGDGDLTEEQIARIEAARKAVNEAEKEDSATEPEEPEVPFPPAMAPEAAAPAPAPESFDDIDIDELDVEYERDEPYAEAPAPAPAPAPASE